MLLAEQSGSLSAGIPLATIASHFALSTIDQLQQAKRLRDRNRLGLEQGSDRGHAFMGLSMAKGSTSDDNLGGNRGSNRLGRLGELINVASVI